MPARVSVVASSCAVKASSSALPAPDSPGSSLHEDAAVGGGTLSNHPSSGGPGPSNRVWQLDGSVSHIVTTRDSTSKTVPSNSGGTHGPYAPAAVGLNFVDMFDSQAVVLPSNPANSVPAWGAPCLVQSGMFEELSHGGDDIS